MDAESIYTTLKNIIINEKIVEVSFVPTKGEEKYKPFIFIENCLGIPFPVVPKTLEFLKKKFVELRKDKSLNNKELDLCIQCILLINCEFITGWNERKNFIKLGYIQPDYDLKFSQLCLTKHPKSSNPWYHRQWILRNFKELINFENENEIIEKAINRYATNYFAWNHRIWLLNYMDLTKLENELKEIQCKMYKYISDHAGWNYLFVIIKKIVIESISSDNQKELPKIIEDHINFVKSYLKEYSGHEAIWYYLRLLMGFIYQYKDNIYIDGEKSLKTLYDNEITFINSQYLDENNPNVLFLDEKHALQYKAWLYILFKIKTTSDDYSKLLKEIETYQCMTGDKSIGYLIDIINNNIQK